MRYLNFILTVIAVCLVYQCVRDTAVPAQAQTRNQPMYVKIVNSSIDPISVELKRVGLPNGSVPVVIKSR